MILLFFSERLSETYNFDNRNLSANCDDLQYSTDVDVVHLDDITANLEDLDCLEMGNVQGRRSGRFVKSKKRNKRISNEIEVAERNGEEQSEQIR